VLRHADWKSRGRGHRTRRPGAIASQTSDLTAKGEAKGGDALFDPELVRPGPAASRWGEGGLTTPNVKTRSELNLVLNQCQWTPFS
jgi:hypothetical protein